MELPPFSTGKSLCWYSTYSVERERERKPSELIGVEKSVMSRPEIEGGIGIRN